MIVNARQSGTIFKTCVYAIMFQDSKTLNNSFRSTPIVRALSGRRLHVRCIIVVDQAVEILLDESETYVQDQLHIF